ncbi:Bypass of stop codon protein [Lachnellula subtilissima]|uniref:Bypass of stop codon protein n=1 Tax=Lachnellula subtilissima TaxID=602034 RepID=A0A8H8RUM9_9HELO|nr:Bypass of stop codon protein [Lachnellula subtilissima]
MSSSITIESPSIPIPCLGKPKKSIQHGFPGSGVSLEMYNMPESNAISRDSISITQNLESLPPSNHESTSSSPPGPMVNQMQTIWEPYKNRFRVLATSLTALANGMNDSANGALIGSIEKHYNIKYGTVSTIFLCNALGFIVAAFFVSSLSQRLGRAKTLIISEVFLILGYVIIVTTPSFGVVAISYFLLGIGMAINLAIGQVYCANLANNTVILGLYQGAYGIGGTMAPLIATSMISRGYLWSRFYIILLSIAAFNLFFAAWAFWGYEKHEDESDPTLPPPASEQSNRDQSSTTPGRRWSSMKTLLTDKATLFGALFIFAYQGAEVSISGWVISFLVQFRNGDPTKVGYVTAGFWAGITLGRFTLSFLAHKMGERSFVFIVTAGALVLEIIVWFVRSIPGDSVAVAFSGLLLGPIYPAAVHIFQRLIPKKMQISSLSLIGSVGTSGGAIAPFMTGMIAQKAGTFVLHPICIGLFAIMAVTWWMLPEPERKSE